GNVGARAIPIKPRSQLLKTLARRSAKTVGLGSDRLSKTLMMPLFSATNTRPSDANWTTIGLTSPLNTVDSEKPEMAASGSAAVTLSDSRRNPGFAWGSAARAEFGAYTLHSVSARTARAAQRRRATTDVRPAFSEPDNDPSVAARIRPDGLGGRAA